MECALGLPGGPAELEHCHSRLALPLPGLSGIRCEVQMGLMDRSRNTLIARRINKGLLPRGPYRIPRQINAAAMHVLPPGSGAVLRLQGNSQQSARG